MTVIGGWLERRYNWCVELAAFGSVAYARRPAPFSDRFSPFSTVFRIARDPESLDPGGRTESHQGGESPRYMDSQASDADAIGIDPVQAGWTILDGADRREVGRISGY